MQAMPRSRYSLLGVKPRWATYGHKLHGPMSKKFVKVGKRFAAIFAGESVDLLRVSAEDCGDFNIRNRAGSTRVSLADISAADQSDVHSHFRGPKRKSNTITLQPGDTLVFGQKVSASRKLLSLLASTVDRADKRQIYRAERVCHGEIPNDRCSQ
jgi:hypothetical protein